MLNKYNIQNFFGDHSVEKPPKKLLEQVSDVIRLKHYSYKTEKSYVNWIKRHILLHRKRHPKEISGIEIEEFLSHFIKKFNYITWILRGDL